MNNKLLHFIADVMQWIITFVVQAFQAILCVYILEYIMHKDVIGVILALVGHVSITLLIKQMILDAQASRG